MQLPFAEAEPQAQAAASIAAQMASPFRLLPIDISQLGPDELLAYVHAYKKLVAAQVIRAGEVAKAAHATAGKSRRKGSKK
jgi:hypothetical protein